MRGGGREHTPVSLISELKLTKAFGEHKSYLACFGKINIKDFGEILKSRIE